MFYGRSIELWRGVNVTGASLVNNDDDLLFRTDDRLVTMLPSDSFVLATYGGSSGPPADGNVPEPGDVLVISWVLEVAASSSGLLRLSTGTTTGVTVSHTSCTEPLGTHEATGAITLAVAQTSYTTADYADDNINTNLYVECISGTVVLSQAKLRVWPAAGVAGGWVTATGLTGEGFGSKTGRISSFGNVVVETTGSGDAMQDAIAAAVTTAQAGLASLSGSEHASNMFETLIADGEVAVQSSEGFGGSWNGSARLRDDYGWIYAQPELYPATSPTGAVDPNEVVNEPGASVRPLDGGTTLVLGDFGAWTGDVTVESVAATHVPAEDWTGPYGWPTQPGALHLVSVPMIDPADTLHTYEPALGGGLSTTITTAPGMNPREQVVPLAGGPCLLVLCRPFGLTGTAPTPLDSTLDGKTWDAQHRMNVRVGPSGLSFEVAYPDFLYYDPTATPEPELTPRFFVKDLDGDMRPVGFGKPATETAVFKIPTPMGRYRDLTTAEYATYGPDARPPGGYPLKVKRVDTAGEPWWDHVAWLVPETD